MNAKTELEFTFHKFIIKWLNKSILVLFTIVLGNSSSAFAEVSQPAIMSDLPLEAGEARLPVYRWASAKAKKKPRAIVLLIHGLTQRAQSLNALAEKLAEQQFIVYGIDQRGHGSWHEADKYGQPGYRCNFKATSNDVEKLANLLHRHYPNCPLYLVGESIGSAVALRAATEPKAQINGLVLCAFGSKMNRIKLSWFLSDMIHILFHPRKEVLLARYQLAYACENPETLRLTMSDPLARKSLSGLEILRASRFVAKNSHFASKLPAQTALLLLKGAEDKIVSPKSAQLLYKRATSANKELAIIPKNGHMLIGRSDIAPSTVSFIENWINQDVATPKEALSSSGLELPGLAN